MTESIESRLSALERAVFPEPPPKDWADRIEWSGIPKRPWGCKRGWLPSVAIEGDGRVTPSGGRVTCYQPSRPIETPIGLERLDAGAARKKEIEHE